MNVFCVSCVNALGSDDCVYITNCGHIFHRHCLLNWIDVGTTTCPECYGMCTASDVRRLYLAFESESSEQETDSNQNEGVRQNLAEQDAMLSELKQKLFKNSVDRKNLETVIANLKAKYSLEVEPQMKDLKEKIQQKKRVQKKLIEAKSWESLHKVLTGSIKDVEQELNSVKSYRQLARMIVLLKRDIRTADEKRKAFRLMLRDSQKENAEFHLENRQLVAKNYILNTTNATLSDNLLNLQIRLGVQQSKAREAEKENSTRN